MNGVKLNMGNSLFNKDLKIEQLSKSNYELENKLRQIESRFEEQEARRTEIEKKCVDLQAKCRLQDLDIAQLQMKLISAETSGQKQMAMSKDLQAAGEGSQNRIEGLSAENSYLRGRLTEADCKAERLAADLQVVAGRLQKAQTIAADLQESLAKKQGEVALLEKTLARKNEHLDLLLKKDKEAAGVQKARKSEVLAERLMDATEGKVTESGTEREWREAAQSAQTQVELLKKKLKRVEEEKLGLEKENQKVKDDNFYLVNRLKTKK